MDKENLALTHAHEHTHKHMHEYYSAIKERNPAICDNIMDLDSTLLSEIIQDGERQIRYGLSYTWNIKSLNSQKETAD